MKDRFFEEQFRAIFDAALDGMIIADDQRRYVDVNPAACELFGRPRAEMLGSRLDDLVVPEVASQIDAAWRSFLAGGESTGEFPLLTLESHQG